MSSVLATQPKRIVSEETKEKLRAKTRTDEQRGRISEGMRESWRRRRDAAA